MSHFCVCLALAAATPKTQKLTMKYGPAGEGEEERYCNSLAAGAGL
jgi:hypothetical protein